MHLLKNEPLPPPANKRTGLNDRLRALELNDCLVAEVSPEQTPNVYTAARRLGIKITTRRDRALRNVLKIWRVE